MNRMLLYIALGGAIGAVARHLLGQWLNAEDEPWGTLSANLIGSLLMGALMGAAAGGQAISEEILMFLGVGILGAFTTMSTFSVETVEMMRTDMTRGLIYVSVTCILAPLLALAGWLGGERIVS